jgi:hypothetical protein
MRYISLDFFTVPISGHLGDSRGSPNIPNKFALQRRVDFEVLVNRHNEAL